MRMFLEFKKNVYFVVKTKHFMQRETTSNVHCKCISKTKFIEKTESTILHHWNKQTMTLKKHFYLFDLVKVQLQFQRCQSLDTFGCFFPCTYTIFVQLENWWPHYPVFIPRTYLSLLLSVERTTKWTIILKIIFSTLLWIVVKLNKKKNEKQ